MYSGLWKLSLLEYKNSTKPKLRESLKQGESTVTRAYKVYVLDTVFFVVDSTVQYFKNYFA